MATHFVEDERDGSGEYMQREAKNRPLHRGCEEQSGQCVEVWSGPLHCGCGCEGERG